MLAYVVCRQDKHYKTIYYAYRHIATFISDASLSVHSDRPPLFLTRRHLESDASAPGSLSSPNELPGWFKL